MDNNNLVRLLLDVSFQVIKRLFILTFDDTDNGDKTLRETIPQKFFLQE